MLKFPCCWLLIGMLLQTTCYGRQFVVVLLDDSASMNESMIDDPSQRKIDVARRALLEVLRELPTDAHIGVQALNSRPADGHWIVPLGRVEQGDLAARINTIAAQGGTPLGERMQRAADALVQARKTQRFGTYRLLIVTDGEAQDGNLVDYYLPQIFARAIMVDVIGVQMADDHSLATRVHSYRRANDAEALKTALAASLAETVVNDAGASESDFSLLASLPDEVAAGAIQALTSPVGLELLQQPSGALARNTPVPVPGSMQPPTPVTIPSPAAPPVQRRSEPGSRLPLLLGICVMLMVFMFWSFAKMQRRR